MIRGLTTRLIRGDGDVLIGAGASVGVGAVFMPAGTIRGMIHGTVGITADITVAVGAAITTLTIRITQTAITVGGGQAMGMAG